MFDINIIQSNNILGEGGFYLHSSNEVVWLDLLKPSISFLNLNKNLFIKEKLNLKTPLGNIYPINKNNFYISCANGIYHYSRKTKKIIKKYDVRKKNEFKKISYNDGTISNKKLWIGLSHIKETKKIGYFGYLSNNNFKIIEKNIKVSNGPAINSKKGYFYFSDSTNRSIYKYNLKNYKRKLFYKFKIKDGYPDGIALDIKEGLWVAHWGGGKISRIKKNGILDFSISLPALNITSITFVGKKMNHLFITSAMRDTNAIDLKQFNHSGSSFLIKTSFKGLKIPYTLINL